MTNDVTLQCLNDPLASIYAHSLPGRPPAEWQRLADHLLGTADLANGFATAFAAGEWGHRVGLWHDLGKISAAFQAYLCHNAEACAEDAPGRVDHSTAGAQHAVRAGPLLGHLPAYCVAGHHSGLLDGRGVGACQESRLQKEVPPWSLTDLRLATADMPAPPPFLRRALARQDSFSIAFFTRMLFSCLVDADFLDTEACMNGPAAGSRGRFPALSLLHGTFIRSLGELERDAPKTPVNRKRQEVRLACEAAAPLPPGLFSLTVPTGGGKTLAALDFAVRHAKQHELQRIVYVAPFTSIIEQNADVMRQHFGREAVLEHHCNLAPETETAASRLAAENWDAPVIATTSVQFYESLFANRTSQCRKLHRLVRSVIILDEAQTLPVDFLKPCLRALDELARHYGTTVVLCTATQPEITQRAQFPIGLEGVREIIPDRAALYQSLRRIELQQLGLVNDSDLVQRLCHTPRALCVVNTTKHARQLFAAMRPTDGHFHLSARMCPAHRAEVLASIRERLKNPDSVCRVVSTQVVEAGVDLDFPVVFRALAGLDSIAQAAGRCNRHGVLDGLGRVFVFQTEHATANRHFAETANCAAQVMELHRGDPLALEAVELYFQLYYWDQKARWDRHDILGHFRLDGRPGAALPFDFDFATVAKQFHIIDEAGQRAVVVPWGPDGRALCARLRAMPAPTRAVLREAQRYVVQVRATDWSAHAGRSIKLVFDDLGILESPEMHYDEHTGLNLAADGPGALFA